MSAVSDFLKKHKITFGVVGTTLVMATAYGSCQFSPSLPAEEVPAEQPAQEEAPAEEEEVQAPEEEVPAEEVPAEEEAS
jgi:hypothetical protein